MRIFCVNISLEIKVTKEEFYRNLKSLSQWQVTTPPLLRNCYFKPPKKGLFFLLVSPPPPPLLT